MINSSITILKNACVVILCLLLMKCHSPGMNYADLEHSDGQKKFEAKLQAQQKVIDSMAKIYKGKSMVVNTFNDFNGDPKKIVLYSISGYTRLDTLKSGDTILLIDVLPEYKFRKDSIVKVLHSENTMIKTKKGDTGMMMYYYIQAFKDELKKQGLETDTI
jgi:hypothetical protein